MNVFVKSFFLGKHLAERSAGRKGAGLLLTLILGLSAPAFSQGIAEQLMGGGQKPHLDKGGFFSVVIPGGFNCTAKPRDLKCQGTRGQNVLLKIEVRDVPRSATPALVVLNQMDAFKKKPHFKHINTKKLVIGGSDAVMASFTYDYLGNVRYGIGVQALYVIRENKLFLIHFEARENAYGAYAQDLQAVYNSFKMAQLDAGGNPLVESLKPKKKRNRLLDPFKKRTGF